jgi:hypothetical protein
MLVFNSCEKVNMQKSQSLADFDKLDLTGINVSFKDNYLVFKTEEDYRKMTELYNSTRDFAFKLKQIFPNFKSNEDAYFEFIESDKFKNLNSVQDLYKYKNKIHIYKDREEIFIDPLLMFEKAKLFNENGIVQIGDELVKRTHDREQILKLNQIRNPKDLMLEFDNNTLVRENPFILKVMNSYDSHNHTKSLEQRNVDCYDYWCKTITSTSCNSHEYRIKGEVVIECGTQNVVHFQGAKTKTYKRGFLGIWTSSKDGFILRQTGTLRLQVDIYGLLLTTPFIIDVASSSLGSDNTIEAVRVESNGGVLVKEEYYVEFQGTRFVNYPSGPEPRGCVLSK